MKPLNLIDKDALIALYGKPCHSFLDVIEDMPTIEAVPMDYFERCLELEVQKRIAAERERNALLEELKQSVICEYCKHNGEYDHECEMADFVCGQCSSIIRCVCCDCTSTNNHWEWHGVKEDAHERNL